MNRILKVRCIVEVPFDEYETEEKNQEAERQIKEILDYFVRSASNSVLFVEEDEHGVYLDEYTGDWSVSFE